MILVVEPQCSGVEHSDVNTALLAVIRGAFPKEMVFFFAESGHLNLVEERATLHNIDLVEYHPVKCPTPGFSDARRLPAEWELAKHVYQTAEKLKARRIIFASVTSAGLWCIKLLTRKYQNLPVTVIPHSILESIINMPSIKIKKPWIFLFWFRFSLIIGNMPQLQYLLFGETKKNELCKILPKIQNYVQSIDLPYFFNDQRELVINTNSIIRFGSFGEWHCKKGTDLFFKLATEVHQKTNKEESEFTLIGWISDPAIRKMIDAEVITPSPDKPLTREEFAVYADNIDYAVFCFRPESFRLTVSGSFYDALSFVKPIIALKTPFFKYYFDMIGDIGYLCNNYGEMLTLIIDLINNRKTKRYTEQCNNILRGRDFLGVENLSVKMRDIIGSPTRSSNASA